MSKELYSVLNIDDDIINNIASTAEKVVRHEIELSIIRQNCIAYIIRKSQKDNRMSMIAAAQINGPNVSYSIAPPIIPIQLLSCPGSYIKEKLNDMCSGCEFYEQSWPKSNPFIVNK